MYVVFVVTCCLSYIWTVYMIKIFFEIWLNSWPSGLRRYVQVVFFIGEGSNPSECIWHIIFCWLGPAKCCTSSQSLCWLTPILVFNCLGKDFWWTCVLASPAVLRDSEMACEDVSCDTHTHTHTHIFTRAWHVWESLVADAVCLERFNNEQCMPGSTLPRTRCVASYCPLNGSSHHLTRQLGPVLLPDVVFDRWIPAGCNIVTDCANSVHRQRRGCGRGAASPTAYILAGRRHAPT